MRPEEYARARERFINLPRQIRNALIRQEITTWGRVAKMSDEHLLAIKGIGPAFLKDIRLEQRLEGF